MESKQSKRVNYTYSMSDDDFEVIIKECRSWSDVARKCGYHNVCNHKTIKKRVKQLGLNVDHINGNAPDLLSERQSKVDDKDVFVENSTYEDRSKIKKRLMRNYGYEHKCNKCGLTEWLGKPIPIELEHKNGVSNDHRIENLEFLCCNCHAQTDTYRGKNIQKRHTDQLTCTDKNAQIRPTKKKVDLSIKNCSKKVKPIFKCITCSAKISKSSAQCRTCHEKAYRKVQDRPSYEQLLEDKKTMTWVAMGKKYGVSDNAVRKWIRAYELKTHSKEESNVSTASAPPNAE